MNTKKMVILTLIITVLFLSSFLLTASSKKEAGGKLFSGQTINIAMIDEPREQVLKDWTSEFEELYGAEVIVDLLGFEPLTTKTLTASQGKTGEYDIMQIASQTLPLYIEAGWLYDLKDWVERDGEEVQPEDIHPVILDRAYLTLNGGWWGMPMHVNSHAFFYRKDIFKEMGFDPPKDWNDTIRKAEAINKKYAPDLYGITFMGAPDIQLGAEFTTVIASLGGYFFDKNYNPSVNSPTGRKAMEIFQELKKHAPPGVTGYALDENYNAFAQGKAAMCTAWTTGTYFFGDPEKSKVADKWEVMSMPGGHAILGMWAMTISEYSKQKEAAWAWLKWATSLEMEKRLLGNMETPRLTLLRDPGIQEEYPNNKAFLLALETDPTSWPRVAPLEMVGKAAIVTNEVLTEMKTPAEGAKELDEIVKEILVNHGYLDE
jgi:multiple sugar transport system substrate-binding protein